MELAAYIPDRIQEEQAATDLKLFEESRSWTPEQWESYLVTLETPLSESQILPGRYYRLAESIVVDVFALAQESSIPEVESLLRYALECLTRRQRQAVTLVFFESKSTYQAALELKISQPNLRRLLRKAIKSLRRKIAQGGLILPLVEEQFQNTTQP